MASLASAFVAIRPSFTGFSTELSGGLNKAAPVAAKAGDKHGKLFGTGFARAAAAGVALLGGTQIFRTLISAAEESAKVSALTAAAIKSTGSAAHVTAGQVAGLANALMAKTGVDDEAIKSGQNMLLTFTRIRDEAGKGNKIFDQASSVLLDMTAAMTGGNVTSEAMRKQAIQLGKALNDPVKGMTALRRVGVTFTQQQTDQVAAMVKSGDVLGAQKLILAELRREFGGAAAAMATPSQRLKTALGELAEQGGTLLLPVFTKVSSLLATRVIPAISAMMTWLHGSSAGARMLREAFATLGGALAAAGSWLGKIAGWLMGSSTWAGILRAAIGGLAAGIAVIVTATKIWAIAQAALNVVLAANPVGLVVMAVAALAAALYYAWTHSATFRKIVTGAFEAVKGAAVAAFSWIKANWPLLLAILTGPIGLAVLFIVKHWDTIKAAAGTVITWIGRTWDSMVRGIRGVFAWVVDRILGFFGTILHGAAWAFGWIPGIGGKLKGAAKAFDQFRTDVNNSIRGINGKTVNVGVKMTASSGKIAAITMRAAGGLIRGGIPGRDSVLGALMPGEVVVPADMVRAGAVDHLRGRLPGFAAGGVVARAGTPSAAAVSGLLASELVDLVRQIKITVTRAISGIGAAAGVAASGPLQAYARRLLAAYGWAGQWPQFNALVMGESGWNVHATNPTSGAYGIPQALPPGKMASAGADWRTSGYTQLRWMMGYIRDVYRSPANAYASWLYRSPHWYDSGGLIAEPILGVGRSGRTYGFRPGETVIPGRGAGGDTYNITVNMPFGSTRNEVENGVARVLDNLHRQRRLPGRW
jgi:hypothetical protein